MRATVVKLGGELIERPDDLARVASQIARLAADGPLVVVHGGGRTIDAELARKGIPKRAVDGLRITDAATLDVVVSVLAGLMNTRLVAAAAAAGARAVGLTGADARIGLVEKAPPHRSAAGAVVDLDRVGAPVAAAAPALLVDLAAAGYVPVVASIGADAAGRLYNVNADTWAAHLAVTLSVARLVFAGGTAGVLDERGRTIDPLDVDGIDRLVATGAANAGMVAKLGACRRAVAGGIADVRIVDGRAPGPIEDAPGTRIVAGQTGSGLQTSGSGRVAPSHRDEPEARSR